MVDRKDNLSIILPVFNEERNIKNVLVDVITNIPNYIKDFEIIVIDDGSIDKSLDVIGAFAGSCPELRVIRNYRNRGYGFTLRKGINNAQKKWLFVMDADGQFKVDCFKCFWEKRSLYDFIIGYKENRKDGIYRKCLAKFGNCIANLLLDGTVYIKDINSGFKLFKTQALKMKTLRSTGGIIYFEILYNLLKEKKKFIQLPVMHYKRQAGKSTGGNFFTIVRIIVEGINVIFKKRNIHQK